MKSPQVLSSRGSICETSDELVKSTRMSILKQAGFRASTAIKYAVVIEKATEDLSAYVKYLEGRIATGNSASEIEQLIFEQLCFIR